MSAGRGGLEHLPVRTYYGNPRRVEQLDKVLRQQPNMGTLVVQHLQGDSLKGIRWSTGNGTGHANYSLGK